LTALGWPQLLQALRARCATKCGHSAAVRLAFLPDRAAVEHAWNSLDEATALQAQGELPPLVGIDGLDLEAAGEAAGPAGVLRRIDVALALSKAAKGAVLSGAEVRSCANLLQAAAQTRRFFTARASTAPQLARQCGDLPDLLPLWRDITAAVSPSGALLPDASPQYSALHGRVQRLRERLKSAVQQVCDDPQAATCLQDTYYSVRNGRYVLPVQASFQARLPGVVHNASQTGQTLFVEPQALVPLGNELTTVQALLEAEAQRIVQALSHDLGAHQPTLQAALHTLTAVDVRFAAARLGADLQASRPRFADPGEPILDLRGLAHPLLLLRGPDAHGEQGPPEPQRRVVRSDVRFAPGKRGLIVSGPNAGGKTAGLTAVGLAILCMRAGLYVPVRPGSSLPFFQEVGCALGDAQDLSLGLSSFSAHLLALRTMLQLAAPDTLLLIDEIAADTAPQEGGALACAVLQELLQRGATVLVTTHLEEVKALGLTDPACFNAKVRFDTALQRPTFALQLDAVGVSNALLLAAQMGLPEAVLQRAAAGLRGGGLVAQALQQQAAAEAAAQAAHAAAQARLAQQTRDLELQTLALQQAQKEAEASVRLQMQAALQQAANTAAQWLKRLQAAPSVAQAQQAHQALHAQAAAQGALHAQATQAAQEAEARRSSLAAEELSTAAPPNDEGGAPPIEAAAQAQNNAASALGHSATAAPRALCPGDWVQVLPLGKPAQVLDVQAHSARVLMGTLRARYARTELQPIAPPKRVKTAPRFNRSSARHAPEAAAQYAAAPLHSAAVRCDVRGLRADDAQHLVRRQLEELVAEGSSVLTVLHGHGSGALRLAVAQELELSPYVRSLRPGRQDEGGAAVTVAELI
jgi:DNA mismatch repair protein MutS2